MASRPAVLSALYASVSNCFQFLPLSTETSDPEVPVAIQALRLAMQITADRNPFGPLPFDAVQVAPLSPVTAMFETDSVGFA